MNKSEIEKKLKEVKEKLAKFKNGYDSAVKFVPKETLDAKIVKFEKEISDLEDELKKTDTTVKRKAGRPPVKKTTDDTAKKEAEAKAKKEAEAEAKAKKDAEAKAKKEGLSDDDCADAVEKAIAELKDKNKETTRRKEKAEKKKDKESREKTARKSITEDFKDRGLLMAKSVKRHFNKKEVKPKDIEVLKGLESKLTAVLSYLEENLSSIKSDKFITDFKNQFSELVKEMEEKIKKEEK